MPCGELRISSMLQAGVCALFLGIWFRNEAAGAQASWWPYALATYAALASVAPWLTGDLGRSDFTLRLSLVIGLLFALPVGVGGFLLAGSPYSIIGVGCWILVAAWGVHLLISLGCWWRGRGTSVG